MQILKMETNALHCRAQFHSSRTKINNFIFYNFRSIYEAVVSQNQGNHKSRAAIALDFFSLMGY